LKNNSWDDFITVFNEVHNPGLCFKLGNVKVVVDEKKKI